MNDKVDTPKAWGDDVPLRGDDAPKNDGHIKYLIEYLLTVHKRFGNTTVTVDLQWGASALWKQDAQKERIAELERELQSARKDERERCAKVCETLETKDGEFGPYQRWKYQHATDCAAAVRALGEEDRG